MNSKRVGNVIIAIALMVLLTGSVSADFVKAGSSIDATLTSVTTHLSTSTMGDQGSPVNLNYDISVTGKTLSDGTTLPMAGSVTAYIRAQTTGGRDSSGRSSQDLTYSDITKASGLIKNFQKSITYRGGINLG